MLQHLKTLSSLNIYIEQSIKRLPVLADFNLGLCPHPDEHEYELVKFQVFSQNFWLFWHLSGISRMKQIEYKHVDVDWWYNVRVSIVSGTDDEMRTVKNCY